MPRQSRRDTPANRRRARATPESRGADKTDLIVGGLLVVLVPVAVYFGASVLGFGAKSQAGLFREELEVPAPPTDQEEVEARWKFAGDLYQVNAKSYIDAMDIAPDDSSREFFRGSAVVTLKESLQQVDELDFLIRKYPETARIFGAYLQNIATLKSHIENDLARLSKLDVLGIDRK